MNRKKSIERINKIHAFLLLVGLVVLFFLPFYFPVATGQLLYDKSKPFIEWPYFASFLSPLFWLLIAFSVVEKFTNPNIYIFPYKTDITSDSKVKFLHLLVINLNWPKFFFLFRRKTAENVSAEIIFRQKDSTDIIKQISGRWTTNQEPETINGAIWGSGRFIDISPSIKLNDVKEGVLDLVVCKKDDDGNYKIAAFNDRSYLDKSNFPIFPNHILPMLNEFEVEVKIISGENIFRQKFLLDNALDFERISIQELI